MPTKTRAVLAAVFVVGLLIRLYFAVSVPDVGDVTNFAHSAAIFAQGGNIFVEQYYWNYSPALALPLLVARALPLPFPVSWRLLLSLVSTVNGLLIARLSGRPAPIFLLWWLNPAVIFLDGFWGQTEALAMLPLLMGVRCFRSA